MIIKFENEKDGTRVSVSYTKEELDSARTNPLKSQILHIFNRLIDGTLSDLYQIFTEEEE